MMVQVLIGTTSCLVANLVARFKILHGVLERTSDMSLRFVNNSEGNL